MRGWILFNNQQNLLEQILLTELGATHLMSYSRNSKRIKQSLLYQFVDNSIPTTKAVLPQSLMDLPSFQP